MKIKSVGKVKQVRRYDFTKYILSEREKEKKRINLIKELPENKKALDESFYSFTHPQFDADVEYKNMSVTEAKVLIGDRANWELKAMYKALTSLRLMNTKEEEKRLAAVRVLLKERGRTK
jgi:transcription antitermination factor NusG